MAQKISQLREGSLNLTFGSPVGFGSISLLHLAVVRTLYLPIIRKAGLPASLGEVTEEASFDAGFSAITWTLLQASSKITLWTVELPCRKIIREI